VNAYQQPERLIICEDRSLPDTTAAAFQPFLVGGARELPGAAAPAPEQTAFALSQVTAAAVLPPLVPLACGSDLLAYSVPLRAPLDAALVRDLALVLAGRGRELGWTQISGTAYLSVIGAGVAVCIDTTLGAETLRLRYDTMLENALFHAGRTADLPRSRLFLQTNLYEQVDTLLAAVREQVWHWLHG
jgi:hypothetical protein